MQLARQIRRKEVGNDNLTNTVTDLWFLFMRLTTRDITTLGYSRLIKNQQSNIQRKMRCTVGAVVSDNRVAPVHSYTKIDLQFISFLQLSV